MKTLIAIFSLAILTCCVHAQQAKIGGTTAAGGQIGVQSRHKPPLQVTTASLPSGQANVAYSATLTSVNGKGTLTWAIIGSLPTGLSLNTSSGAITGTPTVVGAFSFTAQVTDSTTPTPQVATAALSIQITCAPLSNQTTSPLASGTKNVAYSTTFTPQGGSGAITWSNPGGGLPTGISLSSGGVLSGTPTVSGTFTFNISATDSCPTPQVVTQPFTLQINNPLVITTTSPLAAATELVPYQSIFSASGGTAPYTWSVTGSLPAGLSLSSGGVLSGTPTSAGTSTFTVQVTDSAAGTNNGQFSLTVSCVPLLVLTTVLGNGTQGSLYSSQLQSSGGTGSTSWTVSSGTLPPGLVLSAGGAITGTPITPGTYNFTVQVQDSCAPTPQTSPAQFTIVIGPALAINTTSPLAPATVGQIYTQQMSASGSTPPYAWSLLNGSFPPNVILNAAGTISGNVTTSGTFSPFIQVSDSASHTASGQFLLSSTCLALGIGTSSLPQGTIGQPYSQQFTATGGAPSVTWAVISGPLPNGVVLSSTGQLSGTPTQTGTFNFIVQATDSCLPQNQTVQQPFTLAVAANSGVLTISTASLPDGVEGTPYNSQLVAIGGTPPYLWSFTGTLPAGLSMNTAGVISGTPTTIGTKTMTFFVLDSIGTSKNKSLSITVACPGLAITSAATLPQCTVGQLCSFQFGASGGIPPYSWSATGVPAGLSMSIGGLLSGTPTTAATSSINATVHDSCVATPQSTSGSFSLTVNAAIPPVIVTTTSPLPGATEGVAYNDPLAATGGVPPYTWSATGSLPAGLSLSGSGVISGTPTATGTVTPTFKATDSVGSFGTAVLSITVTCPAFSVTSAGTLPVATQNQPYAFQFTSFGGVPSISWTGTSIPAGLSLSLAGALTGTPTGSGTFTPSITATDHCSPTPQAITGPFSLTVNPAVVPLAINNTSPLPSGTQNLAYSSTMTARGGTPPYTWSNPGGGMPTGLSIAGTGIISGTPTVAGTSTPTIRVTDNVAATASGAFSLTINAASAADNRYCTPSETIVNLPQDGPALPLQQCIYTALAASPSNVATKTVCASGCDFTTLTSALASSVCGWTIKIKATSTGTPSGTQNTYSSNAIVLPAKGCSKSAWITVESDLVSNGNFPPEGTRITPAWAGIPSLAGRPTYAQPATAGIYVPKLISTGSNDVIQCAAGANFYRFIGIEFTSLAGSKNTSLFNCNNAADHIILDRVLAHASNSPTWHSVDNLGVAIRFTLTTYAALIDSYVGDTHCVAVTGNCVDSHAVSLGGNGTTATGPIKLVNNFLEAAGESYFSGGGGNVFPTVTLSNFDDEIRRNHLYKPLYWKVNDPTYFGARFVIKNNGEFKNTNRALLEGNIYENNWGGQSDQFGEQIMLGSKNQTSFTTGTATSNGTGTLTATKGTFSNQVVSPNCATPGHCVVKYNGNTNRYLAQTWIDSTHITVAPAPPSNGAATFTAYVPGLNPNAIVSNITIRYNYLTKSSRAITISSALSDAGDFAKGTQNVSIHDNIGDGIDGFHWNISVNACCAWSNPIQIENSYPAPNNVHDVTVRHNTLISLLTGSNVGFGPGFGSGNQRSTLAATTNFKVYDNISAAGLRYDPSACVFGPVTGVLPILQCWDSLAGTHTIKLTWTASVTAGVTSYNVYRSTTSHGYTLGSPYATVVACCTYTDPTVTAGTTYFYALTSICPTCSPVESQTFSSEVSGTVPTVGVAQNTFCFDHNVLATTTSTTGSVTGTANNPPWPAAGQSPNCPFVTTGQLFPASYDAIQFTNLNLGTGGNYLLQNTSPYHNAASDGTDPGANVPLVNVYTAGVN